MCVENWTTNPTCSGGSCCWYSRKKDHHEPHCFEFNSHLYQRRPVNPKPELIFKNKEQATNAQNKQRLCTYLEGGGRESITEFNDCLLKHRKIYDIDSFVISSLVFDCTTIQKINKKTKHNILWIWRTMTERLRTMCHSDFRLFSFLAERMDEPMRVI